MAATPQSLGLSGAPGSTVSVGGKDYVFQDGGWQVAAPSSAAAAPVNPYSGIIQANPYQDWSARVVDTTGAGRDLGTWSPGPTPAFLSQSQAQAIADSLGARLVGDRDSPTATEWGLDFGGGDVYDVRDAYARMARGDDPKTILASIAQHLQTGRAGNWGENYIPAGGFAPNIARPGQAVDTGPGAQGWSGAGPVRNPNEVMQTAVNNWAPAIDYYRQGPFLNPVPAYTPSAATAPPTTPPASNRTGQTRTPDAPLGYESGTDAQRRARQQAQQQLPYQGSATSRTAPPSSGGSRTAPPAAPRGQELGVTPRQTMVDPTRYGQPVQPPPRAEQPQSRGGGGGSQRQSLGNYGTGGGTSILNTPRRSILGGY